MSATEFVSEHLVTIYQVFNKKNATMFVKDQVGRFKFYSDSEYILSSYSISDISEMATKDKNILSDILRGNPQAKIIVDAYNKYITQDSKNLEKCHDVFKTLRTMKEFLNVAPYNDPTFAEQAYQRLIEWSFNDKQPKIDLLRKSFNLHLDKNTLQGVLDKDSNNVSHTTDYINQKWEIYQQRERKDTILPGIAGLCSFFVMREVYVTLAESIPKVVSVVGSLPYSEVLAASVPVGIAGLAFYKTFQMINKTMNKLCEHKRSEMISYTEPEKIKDSNEFLTSRISNNIFRDVGYYYNFDVNNRDNKDYVNLCLFMNEKLHNPSLAVSPALLTELRLNHGDPEVTRLNSLTVDRINEISSIQSPQIRRLFLLHKLSPEKEAFLKQVDNAEILLETDNKKGEKFTNVAITNLEQVLKDKIDNLSKSNQQIVTYYLNVFVSKEGKCPTDILESLEVSIDNIPKGQKLVASLGLKLKDEIQFRKKPEPENKELAYAKQVAGWFAGTTNDHLVKENQETRKLIVDCANNLGCVHHTKVISVDPTISAKVKDKTISLVYKISHLRDKMKKAVGLDVSNSLTL